MKDFDPLSPLRRPTGRRIGACLRLCGVAAFGLTTAGAQDAPAFEIDSFITSGAVLQRGTEIIVEGQAPAGAEVGLSISEEQLQTTADTDGKWSLNLPAMNAGGPYELVLSSEQGSETFEDLYFGDVYLCSGQSNMEFPVSRSMPGPVLPISPRTEAIRLLKIPRTYDVAPQSGFPAATEWVDAAEGSIPGFSAVCWFTAVNLYQEEEVPIGLIDASWGGSQIEAWMTADALKDVPVASESVRLVELYADDPMAAMATYGEQWATWWRSAYPGDAPWAEDSASGDSWRAAPSDFARDWRSYDDEEIATHLGQVWFRHDFSLTAEQAASSGVLSIGLVDDVDVVWLNGEFVGATFSWSDSREYPVPAHWLREGPNTLLINVENNYGQGGLIGPVEDMALHLEGAADAALDTGWSYRIVEPTNTSPPSIPWSSVNGMTTLHNGMIAPLGHMPLAGAIWYQGESNAGRPENYADLLGRLIADWRTRFGEGLPVVIVQLPDYGALPFSAGAAGWAHLREAQRQVAVGDEMTGLVVTMDAGDRLDIHPPNKPLVAARAADVMRALQGKGSSITDGIAPTGLKWSKGGIRLDLPASRLDAVSAAVPIAFESCDAENQCQWADAIIEENAVIVSVPRRSSPAEIRYCWGDAPICNLYADGSIPVAPFRIDVPPR